jgi:hypothetical protein
MSQIKLLYFLMSCLPIFALYDTTPPNNEVISHMVDTSGNIIENTEENDNLNVEKELNEMYTSMITSYDAALLRLTKV